MKRKLQKNKTSLFAVIPEGIVEHFDLRVGDELDFRIEDDHIRAMPVAPSAKSELQTASTT